MRQPPPGLLCNGAVPEAENERIIHMTDSMTMTELAAPAAGGLDARYLAAKRALFDRVYAGLNLKQREAVYATEGPVLVLAGAGSGKTTVLVRRIAFIIRYGNAYENDDVPENLTEARVAELEAAAAPDSPLSAAEIEAGILPEFITDPCPPYRMLAITFTNKAAGEIRERLVKQLGDEEMAKDVWSGTFHSVCMRMLRRDGHRIGYDRSFTIYDTEDQKKTLTAILKRMYIDDRQFPVRSVMNAISREKDKLRTPEDTAEAAGADYRAGKIAAIYREYAAELARSNAMDFDDIIMQTVRLLRTCDDVREYYQKKFRYVCIDEYQDTNQAQLELAVILSGGHHNLMVVGDDDQSIYKFRGATIENILGFDRRFSDARVIKLEQNYRSTGTILEAANRVISHNQGRRGKNLWTSAGQGEKIILRTAEDQVAESRSIVDTIHRMMAKPRPDGTPRCFHDFAVLYRTNSQSSSVERAFAKSAIPYRMVGGTRFNDRKEIRDAIAYLQLISNHADKERLLRIINEPKRKIGDKTLDAIRQLSEEQNCSLFDIMAHADEYPALARCAANLKAFTALIDELTDVAAQSDMAALFDAVMLKTGYMRMLLTSTESETERIENLNELKSNMMEYEQKTENPTLVGFLEENALVADVDKYDDKADAVVLMTVHSAKGLEFPVVFLPGMEDGIFPGMQTIMGKPEDMEEERRLAYVALTRAREQIILIHAKTRIWYGQTVYNPVSRFVEEIPAELIVEEDLTQMQPAEPAAPAERQRRRAPVHTDRLTVGQQPVSPADADAMARRKSDMKALKPGDRVAHQTFGEGVILSVKPMGGDILFEVMFDTAGTKKLMGTYARLRHIG